MRASPLRDIPYRGARRAAFLFLLAVFLRASPPARAGDCEEPFEPCGGILCWNILGALRQPFGFSGGVENMRRDYLTDGDVTELDFVFAPGAEIWPDFLGAAASEGIFPDRLNRNPRAREGAVTVFAYTDDTPDAPDGFVNLNDDVFGGEPLGEPDSVMAYAQCYVSAPREIEAFVEVSSDDSIQVIWDDEEVWIHDISRGALSQGVTACALQDRRKGPVTISPCGSRLLVKVWDGGGHWNFSLRLVDADDRPLTGADGLTISLHPPGDCLGIRFVRGDANADGEENITDAISLLGHLFLGEPEPPCRDAADADDSGALDLSDAIFLLEFLFRGGPPPPAPFPGCGPGPEPALDCRSFPPCF